MRGLIRNEHGAALVMTLLFMSLTFILVVTMLATTGNEVIISSRHRDSVRALDYAQAGLQEAIQRLSAGRPTPVAGFTSSLNSGVTITPKAPIAYGPGSAYREVQVTATAASATRRLSVLVLQQQVMFPPNALIGDSLSQPGNPNTIMSGDVYSRSWVQYQSNPPDPGTLSYSAWRMSRCNDVNCSGASRPAEQPFCYSHTDCTTSPSNEPQWYPGTRRAEYASTTLGTDVQAQTAKCPAGGGGSLPPDTVSGTAANGTVLPSGTPAYGFDKDTVGGVDRAVSSLLPCGLPYKWVSVTFTGEDGSTTYPRLVKTIVYEQWVNNYWQFDNSQMTFVKGSVLASNPVLGSVPPLPIAATTMDPSNFDVKLTGGGTATPPPGKDFGTSSALKTVYMDNSNWTITGASPATGYGSMVIDGNLNVNITSGSNFEYWGTIIVKGTLTLSNGSLIVHGGLVAKNTVTLNGSSTIYGGVSVGSPPVGPSNIIGKGWWER